MQTLSLALILIAVGLILHTIGMAIPAWTKVNDVSLSPFRICSGISCDTANITGWVHASVTLLIIGGVGGLIGEVLGLIPIFLIVCDKKVSKRYLQAAAYLAEISGFAIIIGIHIWGVNVFPLSRSSAGQVNGNNSTILADTPMSQFYSFLLCLVGAILLIISAFPMMQGAHTIFLASILSN